MGWKIKRLAKDALLCILGCIMVQSCSFLVTKITKIYWCFKFFSFYTCFRELITFIVCSNKTTMSENKFAYHFSISSSFGGVFGSCPRLSPWQWKEKYAQSRWFIVNSYIINFTLNYQCKSQVPQYPIELLHISCPLVCL